MDQKTIDMIERARSHVMSAEELERQRISFVYGNSPHDDANTTKDTVRASLIESRVTHTS